MASLDPNSLFSRAEQAFLAKRFEAARADLALLLGRIGDHADVLHLAALVEKGAGAHAASLALFDRALRLAPRNPQMLANRGNLLEAMGDLPAALASHELALAVQPGFRPPRFARAMLLQRLGRAAEALPELEAMCSADPADPALHSARGTALLQLSRPKEAADAFDSALARAPDRLTARHGRARAALLLGEADVVARYRQVRALAPADPEAVLGLAQARSLAQEADALEELAALAATRPDWIVGQSELALLRYENGDRQDYAAHFREALAQRPDERALHLAWWQALYQGGSHAEALGVAESLLRRFGADLETLVPLGLSLVDCRMPDKALAVLRPVAGETDARRAYGRAALAARKPELAVATLEALVADRPDDIGGWALLDIGWRLTGNARHGWLNGQPNLWQTHDIDFSAADLARLAERLRALHRSRAQPLGQSVRGGTQTRGRLFDRDDPLLQQLQRALQTAVEAYRQALPPADPGHPLLRHRGGALAITGVWSVRLVGSGFHVSHIHPEGVLSSACYIALPDGLAGDPSRGGWLELGRAPSELELELPPLAGIEPKPGRLALFPSYLYHGTRPFTDGERLTVAFDVAAR